MDETNIYRDFIENLNEAVFFFDMEMHVLYANPAATALFGISFDSMTGNSFREILRENKITGLDIDSIARAVLENQPFTNHEMHLNLSKTDARILLASVSTIRHKRSHLGGILVLDDITHRKQMEQALRESEDRFRGIFEQSAIGIAIADLKGDILLSNIAFQKFLGYTENELKNCNFKAFTFKEDLESEVLLVRALVNGKRDGYTIDKRYLCKDGTTTWGRLTVTVIQNQEGKPKLLMGMVEDINEQKSALEKLMIQHQLALDLSAVETTEQALKLALRAALKITGMDGGGVYLVDRTKGDLVLRYHEGLSPEFVEQVNVCLKGSERWKFVMSRRPLYSEFVASGFADDAIQVREGIKAIALVPIIHRNRSIGCFNLASRIFNEVPLRSRKAIETIAAQVGNVITHVITEESLRQKQEDLETLFNQVEDIVFVSDYEGRIININRTGLTLSGYTLEEVRGERLLKYIAPEYHKESRQIYQEMLGGKRSVYRHEIITKQGIRIPVEAKISTGRWGGKNVVFGISRDISPQVEFENTIRWRDQMLEFLRDSAEDFLRTDQLSEIITKNISRLGLLLNCSRVVVLKKDMAEVNQLMLSQGWEWVQDGIESFFNDPTLQNVNIYQSGLGELSEMVLQNDVVNSRVETLPELLQEVLKKRQTQSLLVIPIHYEKDFWGVIACEQCDTPRVWKEMEIDFVKTLAGNMGAAIYKRNAEEQIRQTAFRDEATGLPNRLFVLDYLNRTISKSKRNEEYLFAVLLLRITHTEEIDMWNHKRLIAQTTDLLRKNTRTGDLFAYLGENDFAVVIDDMWDSMDAVRLAERLLEVFKEPILILEKEFQEKIQIGITYCQKGHYNEPQGILDDLELAINKQEDHTHSFYALYDDKLTDRIRMSIALEADFRKTVKSNGLKMRYQPVIHMETGKIWGLEALVYWDHPERGVMYPDSFMKLAEDTGLIVSLGEWVLRESCGQFVQWKKQFPQAGVEVLMVNMSPYQMLQGNLPYNLNKVLHDTRISANALRLELTEKSLLEETDKINANIRKLNSMGIQFHLDDFGIGYASINQLMQYKFACLKLDKKLILNIEKDTRVKELIRGILTLVDTVGINIVAEGVETKPQEAFLKSLHCPYAQGYLYHKPQSVAEITELLKQSCP